MRKQGGNAFDTPRLSKAEQDKISYQSIHNRIIDTYCLSCHNKGKTRLTNYSEVYSHLQGIYSTVFEKGTMPKNKVLPVPLRSVLLAWIEAGGPEFSKSKGGEEPQLPPLTATFSSIRERIFNRRCGDCHDPASQGCQAILNNKDVPKPDSGYNKESCHIELSNYDQLLNGPEESAKELIIPGNPDDSQLVISIERTDGRKQMPPPKYDYSPLSDEEKAVIREWILQGAQEN